jgi:membrane-bound lytic murein transglycosylase B
MRIAALALSFLASTATAQTCGGPVGAFIEGVKAEARADGIPAETIDAFFQGAQIDQSVISADRSQGVFQRDFISFSRALISQNRIDNGRANGQRFDSTFDTMRGSESRVVYSWRSGPSRPTTDKCKATSTRATHC